ncbi:MAG: NHL repeat-containing protein [Vicinamibacterales bacterium]
MRAARSSPLLLAALPAALLAVSLGAQQPVRVTPIIAPKAISTDDALLLTHFNFSVSGDSNTCAAGGRIIHVRTPLPGGWEAGPTAAGLTFDNPAGFAVDAARRLYVADRDNRRLVRMDDVAGTGWTALTGNGSDQLSFPGTRSACFQSNYGTADVAVDATGRIYVASSSPHRLIRVDNMSGTGWTTFELPGSNYFSARYVELDAQGRVYLADNQKQRIIRINDMTGAGLVTLGSAGNGVGQFNQPAGMAFDAQGRLYIADEYNHRIVRVNDMTGAGWTTFGSFGTAVGHFAAPHGIDLDSRGRIYVTDTSGYRIVRIDSMDGAGWVTFGNKEFVGRELNLQAAKFLMPVGAGPVMPYRNFFPYVPAGADIRTSVFAVNAGATPATTTLTFQQPTAESTAAGSCRGACFTEWPVTIDGAAAATIARGVAGRGVGTVTASTTASTTGYAWLEAASHVAGVALVQSISAGAVASQAAWAAAHPTDHATIPVDNRNGARTAYVIANPHPGGTEPNGPTGVPDGWSVTFTMTLRSKVGTVVDEQRFYTPTGLRRYEYASDRFAAAGDGFEGTIEIDTRRNGLTKFTTTAMRQNGTSALSAVPVFLNQDVPTRIPGLGTDSVYYGPDGSTLTHPVFADGGGYQSSVTLWNPNDTAVTATVEFLDTNGDPVRLPIAGTSRSSLAVSLPARGIETLATGGTETTTSWATVRVTSASQVRSAVFVRTNADGRVVSEALVSSTPGLRKSAVLVTNAGATRSGFALSNPSGAVAVATFRLRNSDGELAGELAMNVPARGRLAQLVTDLFPGASGFEGTLEVDAGASVLSVIGLRYDSADSSVFTTIPAVHLP